MFKKELLEKYAEVIVKNGINVYKGQPVIVNTSVEAMPLARLAVKKAYEAGASVVKLDIYDDECSRYNYEYQDLDTLQIIPDYTIDEKKYWIDKNVCIIHIISDDPLAFKGIDSSKIQAKRIAYCKKAGDEILNYYSSNKGQWTIVGYPNAKWAKQVFPTLSEEEGVEALWQAILKTMRITDDNDPIKEWDKHNQTIHNHCEIMNKYDFKELRYSNSLGTNLVIQLPNGHIWAGGCEETNNDKKIIFNPNMPTEEIFTCPNRNNVNGRVYSSKPLIHNGDKIDEFWIEFKDGRVIDYDAKVGKDNLKSLIETDEGSHYLGEVALVPYHSPISLSGILFYETLYDENASCHLALGAAYETTVKGTEGKTKDELKEMGVNDSFEHCDFMVGTSDLSIIGITKDGKEIPVFINGDFAF